MNLLRPEHAPPPSEARVGEYRLLTKIGEGGMGVVHLAQAPDGSRVALKVLRPHIVGDEEARERLHREVASLSRVSSPRVAEVLDADPWAETPYVATRYVPGLSLHEHVQAEGPLTGEDLRHFAAGLAEAILAVHAVGVLHRDIKPSNVLLEGRSPVLIDFGLARLAEDSRLTVTGWLLGTPGYLAPEILYGNDATNASDVHAWAATVVFACTGRPPFGRGPAVAVMDRVRRGEHDLSDVPQAWLPMLRACLAADPADRPGLATVLSDLGPGAMTSAPAGGAQPLDDFTLPLALASGDAAPPVPLTRGYTEHRAPAGGTTRPYTEHVPEQPDRTPPPAGSARIRRGALHLSLFLAVAVGIAFAPYVGFALFGLGVLGARTVSRSSDARRNRVYLRGRRRWYDGPVAVIASPWHLLMAAAGTAVLLLWSASVAAFVGGIVMLAGGGVLRGLLAAGAIAALATWWGPWARRLRVPVRRGIVRVGGRAWSGWTVTVGLLALSAVALLLLIETGPVWDPMSGAPWEIRTGLGQLRSYL